MKKCMVKSFNNTIKKFQFNNGDSKQDKLTTSTITTTTTIAKKGKRKMSNVFILHGIVTV